jgi:hypothetical protein
MKKKDMSCTSPYSDILTREILTQGYSLRVKGRGISMYPFVRTGDTLLIEPKNMNELRIGDIIFIRRAADHYVAHRLVKKINATILITKGDNLPYIDEPVPVDQVFGRVVSVERNGSLQSLDSKLNKIINRCWGRLSLQSRWLRPILRPGWKLYKKYHH